MQKFAEKPKGKELDAMKVDTTVLGMGLRQSVCLLYVLVPGHHNHIVGSDFHAAVAHEDLNICSKQHAWRSQMRNIMWLGSQYWHIT